MIKYICLFFWIQRPYVFLLILISQYVQPFIHTSCNDTRCLHSCVAHCSYHHIGYSWYYLLSLTEWGKTLWIIRTTRTVSIAYNGVLSLRTERFTRYRRSLVVSSLRSIRLPIRRVRLAQHYEVPIFHLSSLRMVRCMEFLIILYPFLRLTSVSLLPLLLMSSNLPTSINFKF